MILVGAKHRFQIVLTLLLIVPLFLTPLLHYSTPVYAEESETRATGTDTPPDGSGTGTDGSSGSTNEQMKKKCKKAVGALGWIMCPIVFTVADGVSNLYTFVEQNFMQIRSKIYTGTLSDAWGTFRNIANIFFIVLFLIVILSQLTGVGIDNYGIKRIMPRLIVVAVLINLSYVVCQIVTDVSNIVGSEIVTTMQELSGEFNGVNGDSYIEITINESSSQHIRIVLSKAGGGFIGAGELLIVLFCLVVAFLCILIIWVFCLARDIGIIAMVITAPIAFACMLLPNTEGIYKKWFTLSKTLWTLYPICGLTIGAGSFASAIVYNSINEVTGGTFLAGVTGLFAATLPFVAIPYLLLNALSAFGTIGNKIAGWGRSQLNSRWAGAGRLATAPARTVTRTVKNTAGAGLKAGALATGFASAGIAKHALAAIKSGGTGVMNKRRQAVLEQQLSNATTDEARQKIQEQMKQSNAKHETAVEARKEAGKEARNRIKGIATDTASSAWATARSGAAERNKARVAEAQRREENAKWAKGSTVNDIMERQAVARQNAEIKEEQARNATLDKGVVIEKLKASAAALQGRSQGSSAYQTAESQTIAAIRDIYEKGGKDNLVEWARTNPSQLTPRLIQEISGMSPEFKEYAKALSPDKVSAIQITDAATGNQRAMNFAEFYGSGKLTEALSANGAAMYNSFDKDNWKVYAQVAQSQYAQNPNQTPSVLANVQAGYFASALSSAADGKTIKAQVDIIETMSQDKRDEIIGQISDEQLVKLSNDVRAALAGVESTATDEEKAEAIRHKFSTQFERIKDNERLRSRMSQADQNTIYIDHDSSSPEQSN